MNIFAKLVICTVLFSSSIVLSAATKIPISNEECKIRSHFLFPEADTLPIADWKNPTYEDYVLIKNHLKTKLKAVLQTPVSFRCFENDYLNEQIHGWITYRLGRFNIIQDNGKMPVRNVVYFNNDPEKKDKCVICYSGYVQNGAEERDYPRGIDFIIQSLKASNFDGHFIYYIGGWPNLANNRLKFADVPYGFKPFLFEEAQQLGYQKILWLDAACVPVRSINPLFDCIEANGCCFFAFNEAISGQDKRDLGYVMRALELSGSKQYNHVLSQVVGINVQNKEASALLERWIAAAERKVPFLQPSADQLPFAFLVGELGLLTRGRLPDSYYLEGRPLNFTDPKHHPGVIIFHQYDFLNPVAVIPEDIFRK